MRLAAADAALPPDSHPRASPKSNQITAAEADVKTFALSFGLLPLKDRALVLVRSCAFIVIRSPLQHVEYRRVCSLILGPCSVCVCK